MLAVQALKKLKAFEKGGGVRGEGNKLSSKSFFFLPENTMSLFATWY